MADHNQQNSIIDVYLPTYQIDPDENEKFYPSIAKNIADKILLEKLENQKTLQDSDAKKLSLDISNSIRQEVSEKLKSSRYKIIVQTVIGKMNDQGFRFASRGLWNASTDNYASTSYVNSSLFCTVLIAGLYTD